MYFGNKMGASQFILWEGSATALEALVSPACYALLHVLHSLWLFSEVSDERFFREMSQLLFVVVCIFR